MPAYAANATAGPVADAAAIVYAGVYSGVEAASVDLNLLDARPVFPIAMPEPTHLLYAEIVFFEDEGGVNRASFNGISHTHNMAGALLPALFKQATFTEALALEAPYSRLAAAPAASAVAVGPLPDAAIAFNSDAHYLLPPGAVVAILLNNTDTGEHPIHVHGHSFWIVATSVRPDAAVKYAGNYLRRDVVSIPAGGWAKVGIRPARRAHTCLKRAQSLTAAARSPCPHPTDTDRHRGGQPGLLGAALPH